MNIISQIKDYYDYLAYDYGVDPSLVYRRGLIRPPDTKSQDPSRGLAYPNHFAYYFDQSDTCLYQSFCHPGIQKINNSPIKVGRTRRIRLGWLIVCQKLYIVGFYPEGKKKTTYKLFTKENFPDDYEDLEALAKTNSYFYNWEYIPLNPVPVFSLSLNGKLDRLSRYLNSPVYVVQQFQRYTDLTGQAGIIIDALVPSLAEVGLPSVVGSEQVYQEIVYFLANVLRDSPDTRPPVEVQDKIKVEQHGFTKQSFRKRPKDRR